MDKTKFAKYLTGLICEAFDFNDIDTSLDITDSISKKEIDELIKKDISLSLKHHYHYDVLPENLLHTIQEICQIKCGNDEYYVLLMPADGYDLPWSISTFIADPDQMPPKDIRYDTKEFQQIVSNVGDAAFRNNPRYEYIQPEPFALKYLDAFIDGVTTDDFLYLAKFLNDKNVFAIHKTNILITEDPWTDSEYVECIVVNKKIVSTNY